MTISERSQELLWNDFFCMIVKWGSPVNNCFEPNNVPHWKVQSFSGIWDHFHLKLTKTPVLFQIVAISEICSYLSVISFFGQRLETKNTAGNSLQIKSVPHRADFSFSGVLKHFCLNLTKRNLILDHIVIIADRRLELPGNDSFPKTSVKWINSCWKLFCTTNWVT